MPLPVLAQFSPEVSIGGYAFVTVFYLVLMLGAMWLFKAAGARLIWDTKGMGELVDLIEREIDALEV